MNNYDALFRIDREVGEYTLCVYLDHTYNVVFHVNGYSSDTIYSDQKLIKHAFALFLDLLLCCQHLDTTKFYTFLGDCPKRFNFYQAYCGFTGNWLRWEDDDTPIKAFNMGSLVESPLFARYAEPKHYQLKTNHDKRRKTCIVQ